MRASPLKSDVQHRLLLAIGATAALAAGTTAFQVQPWPIPRCWVLNCKDTCNGTACIACVQGNCGNDNDPTWWCTFGKWNPCNEGEE